MDVGVYPYPRGDPLLIDKIVNEFLSQGKFDKLRKECMSDADTKPAYQNLQQRVEGTVTQFLRKQTWRPDLNKNQLRDSLRKHILESGFFDAGINRIVDQVVNPNVLATVFMPEVEEVVYNYLSIPRPNDKNQRRGPVSNGTDKSKLGSENDKSSEENVKSEKGGNERGETYSGKMYQMEEDRKPKDLLHGILSRERSLEPSFASRMKESEAQIKSEFSSMFKDESASQESYDKIEAPSEESQESLSRMGVDGLQIQEYGGIPLPDSDDSIPLEINEKSMSDLGDSDDSIMNQMSPISQGRLTPDLEEEKVEEKDKVEEKEKVEEEKIEEKVKVEEKEKTEEKEKEKTEEKEKEKTEVKETRVEEKRPSSFIGRIPKLKREDSESSKSSKPDTPKKLDVKHVYSSDESDSSKSYGKSDSDEIKSREKKKTDRSPHKDDKKHSDKERKHDDRHKTSKDRSHDRSDRKRDKSRERHGSKKSSSSSSRERSSSRHKSSHHSRHKSSRSRDHDKKKREEEKRKSKSTDDHGKERHKKEDRRSTDRDSNERERDKASGSRSQSDRGRREREEKTTEDKGDKTRKEDSQMEKDIEVPPETGEIVIEMEEEFIPEDGVILINCDWTSEAVPTDGTVEDILDFDELHRNGALTKLKFPKLTDDFYVKFNSTGFRYFEEWEKTKLDCEDEFKEFVDEAESNLSLLSDDESDLETGVVFDFDGENRKTISNLLKGLGNFRKSAMFDPSTCEFYKWTNSRFYQKFRKKCEGGNQVKNDSDESIKENIERQRSSDWENENRERENKTRHLQLLNMYRRKVLRKGRQRKRHRRRKDFFGGIKEKNENASMVPTKENDFRYKTETENVFLAGNINTSRVKNKVDFGSTGEISGGEDGVTSDSHVVNTRIRIGENDVTVPHLPESPDGNSSSEWIDSEKEKKLVHVNLPVPKSQPEGSDLKETKTIPLNLPLSPDSDDVSSNTNSIDQKVTTLDRKRIYHTEPEGNPKKKFRQDCSQD